MKKILAITLSLLVIIGMAGSAFAQTNLTVLTAGASNVTQTTAILGGSFAVNLGGERADRPQTFFQYGRTTSFGQSTTPRSHSRFSENISIEITNLQPGTTYYTRMVAQNRSGIVYGSTASFNTLPIPGQGNGSGSSVTIMEQPNGNINNGETGGQPTNNGNGGTDTNNTDTTNININTTKNVDVNGDGAETPTPAHIALDISDDRESFTVGDILTYQVEYENVSGTDIDDVFIRAELPDNTEFLSSGEGVYLRKEHAVVFDLGQLEENEDGDVKVNVRAVTELREGTKVAAAAVIFYTNPTTNAQASAVHYDINEYDSDGRIEGGSGGGGFLPNTFLGWLLIVIVLLVIILVGRKIYTHYREQKAQQEAERELNNVINGEMVSGDGDFSEDFTRTALEDAPKSIDEIDPFEGKDSGLAAGEQLDKAEDTWEYGDGQDDDLDAKKKDFLDNLPS